MKDDGPVLSNEKGVNLIQQDILNSSILFDSWLTLKQTSLTSCFYDNMNEESTNKDKVLESINCFDGVSLKIKIYLDNMYKWFIMDYN